MTNPESDQPAIRRILIALDASPHSIAALQAAAELAASLEAELVAVFVEDINLVRLASLEVAIEVGQVSGRVRRIDERRIVYELRGRAEQARRAVSRIAGQQGVKWSFHVVRGPIDRELLQRASEADLVILGRTGWSGKSALGSTAEALLAGAAANTMLLRAGHRLHPTLMVVFDGSEVSERALRTAVELAGRLERFLVVGILAADRQQARQLQTQASQLLQPYPVQARYRWLMEASSEALGRMIRGEDQVVLVLPGESALFTVDTLRQSLQHLQCPILVVR